MEGREGKGRHFSLSEQHPLEQHPTSNPAPHSHSYSWENSRELRFLLQIANATNKSQESS